MDSSVSSRRKEPRCQATTEATQSGSFRSVVLGFTFMPAVSFQVTDWSSLGAGFNITLGFFDYEVALNNPGPGGPDGQLSVNDRETTETWVSART